MIKLTPYRKRINRESKSTFKVIGSKTETVTLRFSNDGKAIYTTIKNNEND